jgi:Tol biopolymer transport system component
MLWRGSAGAAHIGAVDVASGHFTDLTPGSIARYMAPGFLAIGTADGSVMVARFDAAGARLTSAPVPMVQGVQEEGTNGTVQFAVSATGTIVYERQSGGNSGLVWVTRDGTETPVDTSSFGRYTNPALSPDGTQIAVAREDAGSTQVWVKQLATGAFSRLTSDMGAADRPVWAPDGRRVAFMATVDGRRSAFIRRADGSDSAEPAVPGSMRLDEIALDPVGRYTVLRTEGVGQGSRHLLVVDSGKDTVPRTLIESRFDHYSPVFSPDGHWLAYVSEESGTADVYVRPFPNVDSARIAISVGGGLEPVWSRQGTELFFRGPRGEMYAVPVTTGRQFTHAAPKELFTIPGLVQDQYHRSYDVTPDGKRFLMTQSGGGNAAELNVIFNWRAELERLEETGK